MKSYDVDVVVIGGGSAGLAAAIVVKKADLEVLILERDKELGGITLQCIHNGFGLHEFEEELTGPEYIQRFIDQVEELNIPYKLDTMVIEITPEKTMYAVNNMEGLIKIRPKAIILAGGIGERLRPLTDNTPKPLLLIKGKPIIEHAINNFKRHGITNIIISTGYKAEQIKDYFNDGSALGVNIEYAIEDEPLGTGGAIKEASKNIKETIIKSIHTNTSKDFGNYFESSFWVIIFC